MVISTILAQPIVNQMMKVVDYNINIMNEQGIIVASADPSRMNQIHQGALEVIESKQERIIYYSDSNQMFGTRAGVNLPIEIDQEIIGVVGITGDPDEVYRIAKIVKITVESLIKQNYLQHQLQYRQHALENWGLDLINRQYDQIDDLERRSRILKINTDLFCGIIVLEIMKLRRLIDEDDLNRYDERQKLISRIYELLYLHAPMSPFIFYAGEGRFVVSTIFDRHHEADEGVAFAKYLYEKLKKAKMKAHLGVSCVYKGIEGYRRGYHEAKQSLDLLLKLKPSSFVSHIDEWGLYRVLDHISPETRAFYLNRFFQKRKRLNDELLHTLEVFLDSNLNVTQTADKLFIHRNTLLYRLDKIREEWGLNPKVFSDAVKLKLLLLCLKFD